MERRLATIQRIKSINSIEGADRIQVATVLGWQVVVEKNKYEVNDLVVYCEVDSLLPERPEFEFLKDRNYRIKTVKLRGQISQGICFPVSILPRQIDVLEGEDVSELLGIKKYEPQIPAMLMGWAKGNFPTLYIPKTDEIRLQSIPAILDEIRGKVVYVTEKADGTSATYFVREEFGVCSRNLELKEDDKVAYWSWARKNEIEDRLRSLHKNIAFQGELCGPGIQKNRLGLKDFEVFFFNIWDIDGRRFFNFNEFCDTITWLGLKRVKVINVDGFSEPIFDWTLEELLEMAKGKYEGTKYGQGQLHNREGIVIRPVEEVYSEVLKGRMSFKVLNNDYLLSCKED